MGVEDWDETKGQSSFNNHTRISLLTISSVESVW